MTPMRMGFVEVHQPQNLAAGGTHLTDAALAYRRLATGF